MRRSKSIFFLAILIVSVGGLAASGPRYLNTIRSAEVQELVKSETIKALQLVTYPATSRRAGEEGSAVVLVTMERNASHAECKITASTGFARLDDAALAACSQTQFAAIPNSID